MRLERIRDYRVKHDTSIQEAVRVIDKEDKLGRLNLLYAEATDPEYGNRVLAKLIEEIISDVELS